MTNNLNENQRDNFRSTFTNKLRMLVWILLASALIVPIIFFNINREEKQADNAAFSDISTTSILTNNLSNDSVNSTEINNLPKFPSEIQIYEIDGYYMLGDGLGNTIINGTNEGYRKSLFPTENIWFVAIQDSNSMYEKYLWGAIDADKTVVVPFMYEDIQEMPLGIFAVKENGDFWGFIDSTGKVICEPQFEEIGLFYEDESLIAVKRSGKWGFIDLSYTTVIPFDYDELGTAFYRGVIPVNKNGYWGAIDTKGNTVIDFMYDRMYSSYYGNGYADSDNTGTGFSYENINEIVRFTNGYIIAELNEAKGLFNYKGDITRPLSQSIERPIYMGVDCYITDVGSEHTNGYYNMYNWDNELLKTFRRFYAFNEEYLYVIVSDLDSISPIHGSWAEAIDMKGNTVWSAVNMPEINPIFIDINIEKNVFIIRSGEAHTGMTYTYSVYDIDGVGRNLPKKPIYEDIEFHDDFMILLAQQNTTSFYNYNLLLSEPFLKYDGEPFLYVSIFNERYILMRKVGISSSRTLYSIDSKQRYTFGSFEAVSDNIAIVQDQDQVFYGLWINNRLAINYDYTAITYDEHGSFTLRKGADELKVKVLDDKVFWVENSEITGEVASP